MAFELNPFAVSAAPLLRAIQTGGWVTKAELAETAGRQGNNLSRDITALEKAGLVIVAKGSDAPRPYLLTDDAEAQLAALDRAGNPDAANGLTALHADLDPHPLNPRKDFETEEAEEALDELRVSIVKSGLLQPIVVRPKSEAGKWWIIAGERRWRAIGQAIFDGDWEDDQPIPITAREVDDRDHLLLALNENLQRSNMSAIEEGVAFGAAVNDFGLTTDELANRTGKSQRYVQQRIALLKLDPADQDRMRLPKDHPERLSFKAARAMTQTPREPGSRPDDRLPPTQELQQSIAAQPAPRPFGETITDKEALILVEVADRLKKAPAPGLDMYTRIQRMPAGDASSGLISKQIIGFRQQGLQAFVTYRAVSSGAGEWLTSLGFDTHPDDVLFEMRARVIGADKAAAVTPGRYVTDWLNVGPAVPATDPHAVGMDLGALPSTDTRAIGGGLLCRPDPTLTQAEIDDAFAASERRLQEVSGRSSDEPEQPALIEESEDEREAREAARFEATADRYARNCVEIFAGRANDWMKFARFRRATMPGCETVTDWISFEPKPSPEELAVALIRAIATGQLSEAGALMAVLQHRAGLGGSIATMAEMPAELIAQVIAEARAPAPTEEDTH